MPRQPFDDFCQILSIVVAPASGTAHPDGSADWTPARWESVIELASRHFVLPSIAARLAKDRTWETMDPSLQAFFREIQVGNVRRNHDLLAAAERCCAQANRFAIRPILLKGAAHLADAIYDDPGARYVADIDLLVGGDERDRLQHALQKAGYRALASEDKGASFWDDHHHAAPLLAPDGGFVVEVHSDTLREGGATFGLDTEASPPAPFRERAARFAFACPASRTASFTASPTISSATTSGSSARSKCATCSIYIS